MPDRIVREKILTSENVNKLSWSAEVFYRRLMSVVDDYGRFDGRASIIRAECFALKLGAVSEPDVVKWLDECSTAGLVRLYTVNSKPYIELLQFGQKLKRMKAKYPENPTCTTLPEQSAEEEEKKNPNLNPKVEVERKHVAFGEQLLSPQYQLDKEAIEVQSRKFIDKPLLKRFNSHLNTENKNHENYGEYKKHLRNWMGTKGAVQNDNAKSYKTL